MNTSELDQFIETANALVVGIDVDGEINAWNKIAAELTLYEKKEVLGKDFVQNYIIHQYQKSVRKSLDNALTGQATADCEFPLLTKDGRRVMVLLNASTRRDVDGNIVGALGFGQVISELDRYRTETEATAKELRQFIETANAPIFGIDAHGKVNEWNETAAKLTRFTKEEVLGKDLVKTYITDDYKQAVKQVLDNALTGTETANYEFPLFTKDGRRVMVLLNASTRRDAEGKIVGVLGVGQDITILNSYKENLEDMVKSRTKELEESLEREKELGILKTNFVSMASHEFRTPLAAINATADVLSRYYDKLDRDEIDKRLDKIKVEVANMAVMLEDILIIGKSDSQKLEFDPQQLNIVTLVQNIISEYQLGEPERREVEFGIKSQDILVDADQKWIKHIIINLFSNALKYSDIDTPVKIQIINKSNCVIISFEDEGIGISTGEIERLFDPFHRGSNVGQIPGTGLGLAVLKKAIDLHSGQISVESQLGKGSKFSVKLPLKQEKISGNSQQRRWSA